ncbi:MAG: M43 family zinc metalloprotease [Ferruginibacter sp.]
MKKFTFKAAAIFLMVAAFTINLSAQVKPGATNAKAIRCATMEALNQMIKDDPTLPAKWKADGDRIYQESLRNLANRGAGTNGTNSPTGTNTITYVPIVFHLILTAAQQAVVTDELMQRQVDVLNRDFGGLNPDSIKIPAAFKALFGHSDIRFILAKRTPTGTATGGVERLVSAQTFTQATYNTIMKHTSAGGLDQWDGNKYFNVWLGTFTDGLLGIATFPNTGNANEQGVCIHWGSIDLPCGSPFAGAYDGGRTLVHETGHYFYLFHIWGDDGTACTGSDFGTPYGTLPANCTDDTPNQAGPTAGCLSGVHTDACSPTAPGFMYQNYMDYTDDPCYGMFTIAQDCRAQGCIDLYRASLKTSDGATPVAAVANDARVSEVINPASRGFACGTNTNFCSGFTPQVLVMNAGDAAITSLTIDTKVDGAIVNTQGLTGGPLVPGESRYITLALVNPAAGVHTLTVKTSLPNGAADTKPANDSANAKFTQTGVAGILPPITEGFEAATFPSAGYSVQTTDATTWQRTTVAAKTGVASMLLPAYTYAATGQVDVFVSPKLNTVGADVINVDFDLAYAPYSATLFERLEVVYSLDCGSTWINAGYDKSNLVLATAPATTASFVPTAAQWRHENVQLLVGCGVPITSVNIGLRSTNGYGNQLYVDNFVVTATAGAANNLAGNTLTGIPAIVCPSSGLNGVITPTFSFRNLGSTTVTSATLNMKIDGVNQTPISWTGSVAKCATTSYTFAPITVPGGGGNHTVKIYTTNPNGSPDLIPSNDTLSQTFYVVEALPIPSTQGFEAATFPPTGGWKVSNPDAGITWARTTAAAKTGVASAYMDFFAYGTAGQIDILSTPIVPLAAYDTVNLSFDYAYAPYSATLTDTLEVIQSTDCGTTWTSAGWKFGGVQLATNGGAGVTAAFVPTAAQWKNVVLKFPSCNFGAPNLMFGLKAINGYGNELYIDNFAVTAANSYARNAGVVNIIDPASALCTTNFTPKVTISNLGATPLTAATISYSIDGGTAVPFSYVNATGLARCSTAVVTLPAATVAAGNHIITVYTSNPNGGTDLYTANDTASKAFSISPTVPTPVVEGFEGALFPPTGFSVQNPDGLLTWERSAVAARSGVASMVIRNYNYPVANTTDKFYSPVIINNASIDSQFVSFDYAYIQGAQYPGSTVKPLDTLEIQVTQDCGVTFKTIWKNWGADLQTVSEPNYSTGAAYKPTSAGEWRNVKLYLNPYVGNTNYQIYWVAKSNKQNNLYIDNVNISSKTLPQKLKNQGYDIYPNPFSGSFRIHHWVAPVDLQSAQVYTAAGQMVWEKDFNGDANTEINVNMSKMAAGTYILRMVYTNKVIIEKIVKSN